MPTLYEKVVSVIEKDIEDRNDFECQDLISWFRNKSSLFKTLKAGKLFILPYFSVDIPCCVGKFFLRVLLRTQSEYERPIV